MSGNPRAGWRWSVRTGDLVREPGTNLFGIVISEVLQGCDRWFIQWNNGDMYSMNSRQVELVNASR